jgi:hypothetical protein
VLSDEWESRERDLNTKFAKYAKNAKEDRKGRSQKGRSGEGNKSGDAEWEE